MVDRKPQFSHFFLHFPPVCLKRKLAAVLASLSKIRVSTLALTQTTFFITVQTKQVSFRWCSITKKHTGNGGWEEGGLGGGQQLVAACLSAIHLYHVKLSTRCNNITSMRHCLTDADNLKIQTRAFLKVLFQVSNHFTTNILYRHNVFYISSQLNVKWWNYSYPNRIDAVKTPRS